MNFPEPAHLAYGRSLGLKTKWNLSDSCAETLTVEQLLKLSGDDGEYLNELPLGYNSLNGSLKLREAIANLPEYREQISNIHSEHVTVFSGAQEALWATFASILEPLDEVVVFTPCYPSIANTPAVLGAKVVAIELAFANQWQIHVDQIADLLSAKTKILVLNSPHNPTGGVVEADQVEKIIELARSRGIWVLFDDVSIGTRLTNEETYADKFGYDKAVSVGVMSKSFGLAGLRVGWCVSRNPWLSSQLQAIRAYGSICLSAVDDYLCMLALTNYEPILKSNNAVISDNIERFNCFAKRFEEILAWHAPTAGVMSTVINSHSVKTEEWAAEFTRKTSIMLYPATLFHSNIDGFRLGLGRVHFVDMLKELGDFLERHV